MHPHYYLDIYTTKNDNETPKDKIDCIEITDQRADGLAEIFQRAEEAGHTWKFRRMEEDILG